jgi:hypothetical protein
MVFGERCISHSLALLLAQNRERTCTSRPSSHRYSQWCLLWQHVLRFETAVDGYIIMLLELRILKCNQVVGSEQALLHADPLEEGVWDKVAETPRSFELVYLNKETYNMQISLDGLIRICSRLREAFFLTILQQVVSRRLLMEMLMCHCTRRTAG